MRTGFRYGLYGLVFLAAAAVGIYLTIFFVVRGRPEVETPNLVGLDAVSALKAASDLDLYVIVRALDFDDHVPQNHVISQDPAPGSSLKKNREIKVVFSKGAEAVPLPDLAGLPLDHARVILTQSGLQPGPITYTYGRGPEQRRDLVLAQSPEALTPAHPGLEVALLLSRGPRPHFMAMPDLTGQPYSMALLTLERLGLALGGLDTGTYLDWPVESVVVQEPTAGHRVAPGDIVRLTVNRDETGLEDFQFYVMTYHVPYGLFHHEIRIRLAIGSLLVDVHQDWHPAGGAVIAAAVLPGEPSGTIFDDREVAERLGDYQETVFK